MRGKNLLLIALAFILALSAGCTAAPSVSPSTAPTAKLSSPPTSASSPAVSAPVSAAPLIIKAGNLHNSTLGVDIGLGMSKELIDKALGASVVIGSFNFYSTASISISYVNNFAVLFATSSPNWETMDKIKCSAPISDVTKLYGAQSDTESYTYIFDKDSKLTSDASSTVITVIFKFQNGSIININMAQKS